MKEAILVVDDEEDIIRFVSYHLINEGYQVLSAATGEKAVEIACRKLPDLIVLDVMLPGINGLEVTRRLKTIEKTKNLPIIMLSAKGEDADVIKGLDSGVNDYMSKPFSPKELIARIRGILRRKHMKQRHPGAVHHGNDLVIDRGRHRVWMNKTEIQLTLTEFELLAFLAQSKGWVFTRKQIVDAIHGDHYAVTNRSVDVVVVGLRRKLTQYAHLIETVRGIGYRFKSEE